MLGDVREHLLFDTRIYNISLRNDLKDFRSVGWKLSMTEAVPTLDTIQDSPLPYVATNLHFVGFSATWEQE